MSGQQRNSQQQAPKFDVEREHKLFVAALSEPMTVQEYKNLLGPDVDYERFKSSAIDAVSQNWKLLNPATAFRSSLFFSLKKAAKQGLEPDGVQGALVPRFNSDANCQLVQWQPMVKGVQLAGKRAGVLSSLNAQFVLAGEPFRYLSGDDERIEHEWKPDIREKAYGLLRQLKMVEPDPNAPPNAQPRMAMVSDNEAFWEMVVAAYCIVTMPDGTKQRRVMPRTRLLLVRDAAKGKGFSPWFGPFFDEMIVKSAIHWTFKRIAVDTTDPERLARIARFRDALDQDTEADFDDEVDGRTIEHEPPPPAAAVASLPAPNPADRLMRFENPTEDQRVPVRSGQPVEQQQDQARREQPTTAQGQPPADERGQGANQQGQSGTAPGTAEDRALQAAKAFADQMRADIEQASQDQINAMLGSATSKGNVAIASRMDRLNAAYPDLHDSIVRARGVREQQLRQAA